MYMSAISRKKTSLMLPISLTPTLTTTCWNSSLFTDDDIPVLGVVLDASAKPDDLFGMLAQTTSNTGHVERSVKYHMSVSDEQFFSFLHDHLLCLGLLLFSFRLLFSPFIPCS